MCGIVGIISKKEQGVLTSDIKMFKQMLYADVFRGQDGTGLFHVTKENQIVLDKSPYSAHYFMLQLEKDKTLDSAFGKCSKIIVGHNRAATKGAHTKENTHPFQEGHITLVHNGTLWTHRHLKNVDVDSHAICHSIREKGHEKTLSDIDGAFALIWYNQQNKRLYLTRNKERPLNLIELEDAWLISSEPGLAKWIAERNEEKILNVVDVEPEFLYSFEYENTTKFNKRRIKFKEKKIFPVVPANYNYHKSGLLYDDDEIYAPVKKKFSASEGVATILHTPGEHGDKLIPFSPVEINSDTGVTRLIGLTDLDDTVELVVHGHPDTLLELESWPLLVGRINYRKIVNSGVQWVMTDVKKAYQTLNESVLTEEDLHTVEQCKCIWCDKPLNPELHSKLFIGQKENGEIDIEDVYCDECSEYALNLSLGDYRAI